MFKTILVPATGTDADEATFAAAAAIGQPFASHLIFLHVGHDWVTFAATMSGAGLGLPIDGEVITRIQEEATGRAAVARASFERFCETNAVMRAETPSLLPGMSAEYRVEAGSEADIITDHGRTADLILIPRDKGGMAPPVVTENALFESGRPLLLLGSRPLPPAFRTVAIAWKATREAAHAVAAAMPFIERAERVLVLEVGEDAPFEADDSARLTAALQWHRPNVSARFLTPGDDGVAATLLAAAREGGADLLVMGGYGHSRFRQFVFGGVTDTVTTQAPLPILMAH
ncbi:MAG: universal stress protein [Alphaproteobacteria bacterium]|jgi:nucleotide-binding universal stress UspA family protein|nr:universal stress protein [Alphaproteobacteria bacterium]